MCGTSVPVAISVCLCMLERGAERAVRRPRFCGPEWRAQRSAARRRLRQLNVYRH